MRRKSPRTVAGAVLLAFLLAPPAGAAVLSGITLSKTVITPTGTCPGVDPLQVAPGTPVPYCYLVSNQSALTYTTHSLTDSVLGTIPVTPPCTLAPFTSNACTVRASLVITMDTMNLATWVAMSGTTTMTGTDTANVMVFTPTSTGTPTLTPTLTPSPGITPTPTKTPVGPIITGGTTAGSSTITGNSDPGCVGGKVFIFDCGFPPNCHHCAQDPNVVPCDDPLIGFGTKDANGNFIIPATLLPAAGHEIYATDTCRDPGLVGPDVVIQSVAGAPALSPVGVVTLVALLGIVGAVGLSRLRRGA